MNLFTFKLIIKGTIMTYSYLIFLTPFLLVSVKSSTNEDFLLVAAKKNSKLQLKYKFLHFSSILEKEFKTLRFNIQVLNLISNMLARPG